MVLSQLWSSHRRSEGLPCTRLAGEDPPWVFRVCGLVETQPVHKILEFLSVPREC
jgi:hypothetical protein